MTDPVSLADRIAELEEEVRQLRALAFGADVQFPLEWNLTPIQTVLMRCLVARSAVTWDVFAAACEDVRLPLGTDDPAVLKAHIYLLRKKLAPLGVPVRSRWGCGYWLDGADRLDLRKAYPARRAA